MARLEARGSEGAGYVPGSQGSQQTGGVGETLGIGKTALRNTDREAKKHLKRQRRTLLTVKSPKLNLLTKPDPCCLRAKPHTNFSLGTQRIPALATG